MWLFNLLLHLAPKAFRYEYGDEMRQAYKEAVRDGGWLAGLREYAGVLGAAMREHADLLRADVRSAMRAFRRNPGFPATAVIVVALGVGANIAIFSALDHVLLRPLPFPEPERLIVLSDSGQGYSDMEPPVASYLEWQRRNRCFERMGAWAGSWLNITGVGTPERLEGARLTHEILPLLRVEPLMGRAFRPEDNVPGAPQVILLSYGLWQRLFGGDPAILGRDLRLDGFPYRVIGVMKPEFHFPFRQAQFWVPTQWNEGELRDYDNRFIHVVGRLRGDVTPEAAKAEMEAIQAALVREHPSELTGYTIRFSPLANQVTRRNRSLLWILGAAAACLLLIACANLANLLLARAAARRKEYGLRALLGAGSERLIRQALTESLMLSLAGGAAGTAFALGLLPALKKLIPDSLPIDAVPAADWRLAAFAFALSVLTGLLFGVLPAWSAARRASSAVLKEGCRDGVGGRRAGLRDGLVVVEVALSFALLVSAGLMLRTLWNLSATDPGFRAENLLSARTLLPYPKYKDLTAREHFYREVLGRVRALPGVTEASYASFTPLTMRGGIWGIFRESDPRDRLAPNSGMFRIVTPRYFQTIGIPILAGRDVAESDVESSLQVAVVSQSFADKIFPQKSPLGMRFYCGSRLWTIVGVVGNIKARGLDRVAEPQMYFPYRQWPRGVPFFQPKDLAIRSTLAPAALIPAVRRIVQEVDPDQPVSDMQTFNDILEEDTASRRLQLSLLAAFAGLAFLLAAVGLEGVLSFLVAQRTQEIGVRLAIGAQPSQILRLFLGRGMKLTAAGLLAGAGLAAISVRYLEAVLFGVQASDPMVLTASTVLCLGSAIIASYWPARRATRIDPIRALQAE